MTNSRKKIFIVVNLAIGFLITLLAPTVTRALIGLLTLAVINIWLDANLDESDDSDNNKLLKG